MNFFTKLFHKKDLPEDHIWSHYLIMLKSARRCAYDLRHAADLIGDDGEGIDWNERAEHWLRIFAPGGVKDYRQEMQMEIMFLEMEIQDHVRKLEANGIPYSSRVVKKKQDEDIPF